MIRINDCALPSLSSARRPIEKHRPGQKRSEEGAKYHLSRHLQYLHGDCICGYGISDYLAKVERDFLQPSSPCVRLQVIFLPSSSPFSSQSTTASITTLFDQHFFDLFGRSTLVSYTSLHTTAVLLSPSENTTDHKSSTQDAQLKDRRGTNSPVCLWHSSSS